jgi:heme oxygenase (biliverdin-IX-beta and delta-forming)
MSNRRSRLKAATAQAHRALEADLEASGYLTDAALYPTYLARLSPLQTAIEDRLDAIGAGRLLADWPARRKARLIAADLEALGLTSGPEAIASGADVRLASAGGAFGALYVLEGATLGGALLARRLACAGIPAGALAFLTSYGPERGRMWRAFLARLEAARLDAAGEADMVRSALATFAAFRQALLDGTHRLEAPGLRATMDAAAA